MSQLLLEIYGEEGDKLLVPIETAICLSVLEYTSSTIEVVLILNNDKNKSTFHLNYSKFENFKDKFNNGCSETKTFTSLPTIILEKDQYYVAGLAAVLRQIVKTSNRLELLGFRQCCLAAPAEVSCWTRFCEVDIVYCLSKRIHDSDDTTGKPIFNCKSHGDPEAVYLPEELTTLEFHLSVPAKVHQKGKYGEGGPKHDYVEGPHMVVSDLVIAVCVHLILSYFDVKNMECMPFIHKWLERVKNDSGFEKYLVRIENGKTMERNKFNSWILPELDGGPVDLYKKEGTRRKRIFTQGDLLSSSLEIISEIVLMEYRKSFEQAELDSIGVVLPDVPEDRLERKIQQLNNLAKAALMVAKDGDLIVDFCCGSGHLGLLLAKLLPACTIVLLDNKEKSSERAQLRVEQMNLTNVRVVQSNLDYFIADFQVGVSLHACGVASDLVINKCLGSKAHLILCPCCYGGIQSNHIVNYPQSTEFQKTGLNERSFFVLAHNADTCDTEDGHIAMTAVDTDRCFFISENGYSVTLSKLQPLNCTTRNNLIVAVRS